MTVNPDSGTADAIIRCVVADDQQLVREGFAAMLAAQPDMTVVGQAGDGAEAVRLAQSVPVDVVLMDIRMPGTDGITATRQLADTPTRVLILTTFDLDDYVYDALRAGASGFLLKDSPAAELSHAVRVVAAGDALLAPAVTRRLIATFAGQDRTSAVGGPPAGLDELTARELEVLRLLGRGRSNYDISVDLTVAMQTVKTHVSRVLSKLQLRDRAQAVVLAYESGLITPGRPDEE